MDEAIKSLRSFLTKSPSVVYPEDVLAYLPAIEAENAKLREYITKLEQTNIVLDSDNTDLLCDMKDMQFFIDENAKLRAENAKLRKLAICAGVLTTSAVGVKSLALHVAQQNAIGKNLESR